MKKATNIVLSSAIAAALLLAGCDGGENRLIKRAEISEVRENFEKDCESLKNKSYENLNFKDASFSFADIDEVSELTLTKLIGKSADEMYEYLCGMIDELTDNYYTDEEKKKEIRFVDADLDNGLPFPYNCPTLDEYKNGLETDDPLPCLNTEDYSISILRGVLYGFDNGALIDYDNSRRTSGMYGYQMLGSYTGNSAVFFTDDLSCTDTYRLVDGEISIADAAKFAQDYLDNLKFTPYDGNIPKPRIVAVNVADIGEGCYGYNFITTVEYKGVNFDYRFKEGKNTYSGHVVQNDYDDRSYYSEVGYIDMIETDKIHHFVMIAHGFDVTEGKPQTSIVTLESAADLLSEFLSGAMMFTAREISVVWLETSSNGVSLVEHAYPCWKFRMSAGGAMYDVFVNMVTGEIYLYTELL
ncbi:MAG: hypothetical protein J1F28_06960 [Oscillospiraceae bacterium]|nr:hypothetical protein [Oscillospiraceae bacterium]